MGEQNSERGLLVRSAPITKSAVIHSPPPEGQCTPKEAPMANTEWQAYRFLMRGVLPVDSSVPLNTGPYQ